MSPLSVFFIYFSAHISYQLSTSLTAGGPDERSEQINIINISLSVPISLALSLRSTLSVPCDRLHTFAGGFTSGVQSVCFSGQ